MLRLGSAYPRVSVVTPSFNQAAFLEETIQSVLAQDYPNLEYIIIDGGSTDGSIEIIRKYESQLAYWVSERDEGQSHAINKGFQRSSGEILAWLNSDDLYAHNAIHEAVAEFDHTRQSAVVYGNTDFIDASGKWLSRFVIQSYRLPQMLYDHLIPQPAAFVRRSALDAAGGIDPTLHFCMDYDLWLRVARTERIQFVPRLWAKYRVHEASKSTNLQALRWRETARVLESLFAEISTPPPWRRYEADAIGRAHWHATVEYSRANDLEKAKEHVQRAVQEAPRYLTTRELVGFLVGSVAGRTNEESFPMINTFFDLIPDTANGKKDAQRMANARVHALMALDDKITRSVARNSARRALKLDAYWFQNRHVVRRAL